MERWTDYSLRVTVPDGVSVTFVLLKSYDICCAVPCTDRV